MSLVDELLGLIDHLDDEEAELFDIGLRTLNSDRHGKIYMYGVGKYYCHLDLVSPLDDL